MISVAAKKYHKRFGHFNPPLSYGRYNKASLSLGLLLFQIKFENVFLMIKRERLEERVGSIG